MGRLYGKEDNIVLEVGRIVRDGEPIDIEGLYEADSSVGLVTESIKQVSHNYATIKHIETAMLTKNPILVAEAYNPILKSLADSLGYKAPIPSLEDYRNPYALEASKEVSLEGFKEFIKKIWESIRKFFVEFFKKVSEFGKRLINANLQIDTYERYVPELLKKISRDKLVCEDPKREVNTELVKLLAPEGLDKLDGVWVPQNVRGFIIEIASHCERLTKGFFPELANKVLRYIHNTIEDKLRSIGDLKSEEDIQKTLEDIRASVKKFIEDTIRQVCPNDIKEQELPEEAFEKLSDMLVNNKLSDLSLRSFSDNKHPIHRLPKNFNLIIAASDEDKLYSVSVIDEGNSKTNTIPVLPDLKALEIVYDEYKTLTKKFDIKAFTRSYNDIDKAINQFLSTTPKMFDTYRSKYSKLNFDDTEIDVRHTELNIAAGNFHNTHAEQSLIDEIEGFASKPSLTTSEVNRAYDLLMSIRKDLIKQELTATEESEIVRIRMNSELVDRVIVDLKKLIKDNTGNNGNSGDSVGSVVAKEIDNIEKMLINFVQNLQVALRAVETTFPSIVTDLRYELLKYVYDSARTYK